MLGVSTLGGFAKIVFNLIYCENPDTCILSNNELKFIRFIVTKILATEILFRDGIWTSIGSSWKNDIITAFYKTEIILLKRPIKGGGLS